MTSGTPMIGYRLEGIPEEYYEYMITPNDYSVEELSHCISSTLSKSQDELGTLALKAFRFVIEEKSSDKQVKKMIDFLS